MKIMNIGIIGCGDILSRTYLPNIIKRFKNLYIYALCDLNTERARTLAEMYDIKKVLTFDELLADPAVDIILNTTTPQAHFAINMAALKAGKHVYSEKPLGMDYSEAKQTLDYADAHGLYIGCAPDVFLGGGVQACKKILDNGVIGDVIGGKAFLMYHGPESIIPEPDLYYKKGAGPILDVGPYSISALLYFMGPAKELCCYGGIKTPKRDMGDYFVDVEVNTHMNAVILFESGHSAGVAYSWETWGAQNGPIVQIYGTKGSLFLSDPDNYGDGCHVHLMMPADVDDAEAAKSRGKVRPNRLEKIDVPLLFDCPSENRGLGLSEMADAIQQNRKNRANGEFACHVTEVLDGFNISIATGKPCIVTTRFKTPPLLETDFLIRMSSS